jgi:hypothetical protein
VAAAFVSALAGACRSQELGATFLAELADKLDVAYVKRDT